MASCPLEVRAEPDIYHVLVCKTLRLKQAGLLVFFMAAVHVRLLVCFIKIIK